MKHALVTGASKGIGKEITLDLLKKDHFVLCQYSNDDKAMEEATSEFKKYSKNFKPLKVNFCNKGSSQQFAEECLRISEKWDVLVFNAGITKRVPMDETTEQDWDDIFNVNLKSPFFIIQKLKNHIEVNGRIIFIGATMGIFPHSTSVPYAASKSALHMMTKSLVKEFATQKVTVNTVAPGFVETPMQLDKPADHRKRICDKLAVGRFADTSEISKACMSIIDNSYINGHILVVDGGYNFK